MAQERPLDRVAGRIENVTQPIINTFFYAGTACIILMMLLTVVDVVLRFLFHNPILGAYEISECLMVVLVFSSMAYTEKVDNHVKVDIFYLRLSDKLRGILDCITNLMGSSVLFLIVWTNIKMAYKKWIFGDITGSLPIPIYPMHLIIAAGSALFCAVLLVYTIRAAERVLKR
ncbi:MAG: TRAP transporter small permease [Deltaproteobacteria bacterium]|nr:TRAP transporter small permease [Deltaproteobacteria bacterium]